MRGQTKTMRGLLPSAKKMISFNGRQSSSFEKGNATIVISIVAVLIIFYIINIPIISGVDGGLLLLLIVCLFSTRRRLESPLFEGHKEGHDKCEESGIRGDQLVALSGKPACRSEQPTSQGQNLSHDKCEESGIREDQPVALSGKPASRSEHPTSQGQNLSHDKCEESGIRDDQPVALSGKPACRSEQPTCQAQNLGLDKCEESGIRDDQLVALSGKPACRSEQPTSQWQNLSHDKCEESGIRDDQPVALSGKTASRSKQPTSQGQNLSHDKCEESGIRDDQPVALSGKPACRSEQPTCQAQNLGTIPSMFNDFRVFEMEELVAATDNFHDNNKLGQGGFGAVYKGITSQGSEIAVKKWFINSREGQEEFQNEVMLVAKVQHRNLLKLLGCCVEGSEKLIVYEYIPNNCLHKFLFDPNKRRHLDWQKRYSIILGISRGLLYLHEDSHLRIIHRDIKAGNILLDKKFNPKIADFGIARLLIDDESYVRTSPAGTRGYMAPEYVMAGKLSVKVDVYSFGILLLELIFGRKNLDFNLEDEKQILLEWVRGLNEGGNLMSMIDPVIIETCSYKEEVLRCIHVALLCTQAEPSLRPSLSRITLMLSTQFMITDPAKPDFVSSKPIHGPQSTTISGNQNDLLATKSSTLSCASTHTRVSGPSRTSANLVASTPSMVPSTRRPDKLKFWKGKIWRAMFWEKTSYSGHGQVEEETPINHDEQIPFTMETLQAATRNFHDDCKLGEGRFGPVYKGTTPDGKEIAVRKLSLTSMKGKREFLNEVKLVAKIQHRNLVNLLGCCSEGSERLLVYEYLPNESLDQILFDPEERIQLDWEKRYNIILGVARGLLYLHQDFPLRIIHPDIKASKILLDEKLNPKILSDFSLARLFPEEETHVSTGVIGTCGYMAPEYLMCGKLSVKADVYSFGVLLLELIAGRKNTDYNLSHATQILLGWAWRLYEEGNSKQLIDPSIIETCDEEQALRCIHVALLCTQEDSSLRPPISRVTMMLSNDSMITLPDPTKPVNYIT